MPSARSEVGRASEFETGEGVRARIVGSSLSRVVGSRPQWDAAGTLELGPRVSGKSVFPVEAFIMRGVMRGVMRFS